jgi:hypothetical protein
MSATGQASQLRLRARQLHELARTIESTPAMSLDQYAGDDTWRGHRPTLCRAVLLSNQHQVHDAVEELRWQAHRLEQHAQELEAAARLIDLAG